LIIYTLLPNNTVYHTKHIYEPTDSLQFLPYKTPYTVKRENTFKKHTTALES